MKTFYSNEIVCKRPFDWLAHFSLTVDNSQESVTFNVMSISQHDIDDTIQLPEGASAGDIMLAISTSGFTRSFRSGVFTPGTDGVKTYKLEAGIYCITLDVHSIDNYNIKGHITCGRK